MPLAITVVFFLVFSGTASSAATLATGYSGLPISNPGSFSTVAPPGCSDSIATAPPIKGIKTTTVSVPASPFGISAVRGGNYIVASFSDPPSIEVLARFGDMWRMVRNLAFEGEMTGTGIAASHNGKYLAVTQFGQNSLTTLVSIRELVDGAKNPILGQFADDSSGSIEAIFSVDDRYLFVSDENSSAVSVFDLALALREGFSAKGVAVGQIPLAPGPVGSTISPDGRFLYVTSEFESDANHSTGELQVVSIPQAEKNPKTSIITAVAAGCQPVRVAISGDGTQVWVTARGSDSVLIFNALRLRKSPSEALESVVQVGQQPVPIGFVDGGRYAIVGNSARFSSPSGEQTLSVINTLRAIRGEKSLMGTIQAGSFPRELSFDPASNEVLLTNFNSDNIEFIEISSLGGLRILTSPALVSVFQRIQ